jgi:excisionase family DNA binding protein
LADSEEKFYTVDDIVRILKVDPESVRIWLRKGDLKGIRLAKEWRISESEFQKFIGR